MKKLLVLIPESIYIKYFVYSIGGKNLLYNISSQAIHEDDYKLLLSGKINFRGSGSPDIDLMKLVKENNPESIAVRVLYGGGNFKEPVIFDKINRVEEELEKLVLQSPIDIPIILKLLNILKRLVPVPEIILYFETAFFTDLPKYEQMYALDKSFMNQDIRRFGYHGLFTRR